MVLCVYSGCGVQRSTWCSRVGRCVFRSWPQFVCVDVKSRVVYSGMRHMGYRDPVAVVLRCLTMYHACLTHRASLSLSLSPSLSQILRTLVHTTVQRLPVSHSRVLGSPRQGFQGKKPQNIGYITWVVNVYAVCVSTVCH